LDEDIWCFFFEWRKGCQERRIWGSTGKFEISEEELLTCICYSLSRAVFIDNKKRLTNWMKEKKSHILRFWPNTTTCKCFYFTCKNKGIITTKKYRISLTVLIPCLTQFASVFLTMLDQLICPCRYRIFEKQTNK